MRLFASPEEKERYEQSRKDISEKVEIRKVIPRGRLESSQLPEEVLEKLRKQARWED